MDEHIPIFIYKKYPTFFLYLMKYANSLEGGSSWMGQAGFTNLSCIGVKTFTLFNYAVHGTHMYFQQLDSLNLNIPS